MADNSNAIVFEQMLNTFYNNSVNLGLSERQNRIIAAKFAISYGHGGIVKVAKASGLSRKTIEKGVHEDADYLPLTIKRGYIFPGSRRTFPAFRRRTKK